MNLDATINLPPFAPFPDVKSRQNILPSDWAAYLNSWTLLADLHLRLDDVEFSNTASEESSLTTFLVTFLHELGSDDCSALKTGGLRKKCFLLLHRIYSGDNIPVSLLNWSVLSDACRAFVKTSQFRTLLGSLWQRKAPAVEKSLQPAKNSLVRNLDSIRPEEAETTLNRIAPLLKVSPDASAYMLTGSDFLDSLCNAYPRITSSLRTKLCTVAYFGLTALLEGPKPNFSLLSDHLYSLKTNGEQHSKSRTLSSSLIVEMVTNTPILDKILDKTNLPDATRVRNFAVSLGVFKQPSLARPKKPARRKIDKGKSKVTEDIYENDSSSEAHVHRMSIISQIKDLFPDLGSAFVAKLLHEYNDNVEEVISHLLEDTLPSHLARVNRSEQLPDTGTKPHLTPRSTPPPIERRNVFDNDEFDRLAVDTSRIYFGRKDKELTADNILSDRNTAPRKSAILAALAVFDLDDDERDDTYDAEDVGGTVDSAAPGPEEADANLRDKNEETLLRAYSSTPNLFARDSETRRSKERAALKSETNMTDEAIEGWGLMIGRDPKRLRRLEAKFSAFSGQQTQLVSTAWRESPTASDSEGIDGGGEGRRDGRGGTGGRGRGRGRGGRGRGGGNVAGPSDDKSTQVSRQRKEANKGSRANHNRRDQRAKKMARGGLTG